MLHRIRLKSSSWGYELMRKGFTEVTDEWAKGLFAYRLLYDQGRHPYWRMGLKCCCSAFSFTEQTFVSETLQMKINHWIKIEI